LLERGFRSLVAFRSHIPRIEFVFFLLPVLLFRVFELRDFSNVLSTDESKFKY
jgi:hypothetical protein